MRVLVAHESARVRDRIRRLSDRFEACDVAVSGSDAVTAGRLGPPEPRLILLSATLAAQHADGVARLLATPDRTPVVVVASRSGSSKRGEAVQTPDIQVAVQGRPLPAGAVVEIATVLRAFVREIEPRSPAVSATRARPRDGSPRRSLPEDAQLTEVEREVLAGLAAGASTAAMADSMGLTEATVDGHVTHVLSKLHRRGAAAPRV